MDTETKKEFNKIHSQLDKLLGFIANYHYSKAEIDEMRANLATKDDVNKIINMLDRNLKKMKDRDEEAIIAAYRTKRLETWAGKAGAKIGIQYNP